MARKTLKITQEEFARPLAITRGYVASIENSLQEPSETLLRLISSEHGISVAWLKSGEGEMFVSPEEIIKKGIERFGEQFIASFVNFIKNVPSSQPLNQIKESAAAYKTAPDPDLDRMLNVLRLLWSLDDDRLKAWAAIQFDRAFPQDIIEEALKKLKDSQ